MDLDKVGQGATAATEAGTSEHDARLPYTAPALDTVAGKLAALLGSVCPENPETGVPAQ